MNSNSSLPLEKFSFKIKWSQIEAESSVVKQKTWKSIAQLSSFTLISELPLNYTWLFVYSPILIFTLLFYVSYCKNII